MICLPTVKRFCNNYKEIENYDLAIADNQQTWHCHHRKEDEGFSADELKECGKYYNIDASELIFLTCGEHHSMHASGNRNPMYGVRKFGKENPCYGVRLCGEKNGFYGKKHTGETKQKISESRTGKCCGKEHPNYKKLPISDEELKELYDSGISLSELGRRCNTGHKQIKTHIKNAYHNE